MCRIVVFSIRGSALARYPGRSGGRFLRLGTPLAIHASTDSCDASSLLAIPNGDTRFPLLRLNAGVQIVWTATGSVDDHTALSQDLPRDVFEFQFENTYRGELVRAGLGQALQHEAVVGLLKSDLVPAVEV